jgi:hypothetical protein
MSGFRGASVGPHPAIAATLGVSPGGAIVSGLLDELVVLPDVHCASA